MKPTSENYTQLQRALAFSAHIFTSTGIVAAFLAILAITHEDWRFAMIWLFVCLIIDGLDGSLARKFKTKEILPGWNGQTIDNVIDFATYAIIPAFFLYEAKIDGQHLLPDSETWRFIAVACLLMVSALYYGKEGMVSDDYCFIGFPVMWNLVAFYLFFVFPFGPWINFGLILFFSLLHFIPIKFAYPSRKSQFFRLTLSATAIFLISNAMILFSWPVGKPVFQILSTLTIAYFAGHAVYKTWLERIEDRG